MFPLPMSIAPSALLSVAMLASVARVEVEYAMLDVVGFPSSPEFQLSRLRSPPSASMAFGARHAEAAFHAVCVNPSTLLLLGWRRARRLRITRFATQRLASAITSSTPVCPESGSGTITGLSTGANA